jgi:hypothetical protein
MVVDRRAEAAAVSAMVSGSRHGGIRVMSHLDGALAARCGRPNLPVGQDCPTLKTLAKP